MEYMPSSRTFVELTEVNAANFAIPAKEATQPESRAHTVYRMLRTSRQKSDEKTIYAKLLTSEDIYSMTISDRDVLKGVYREGRISQASKQFYAFTCAVVSVFYHNKSHQLK